jgi:putative ABC transport system permease protein
VRNPPAGTVLIPVEADDSSFNALAAAFRTNLTALGLLALIVGMFLIYSTMSFTVVQRRFTLGVLRALGLTQRAMVAYVLVEALALGRARRSGLLLGTR